MTHCEMCQGRCKTTPATVRVTYGLYSAYEIGRPHHTLALCSACSKELWDGVDCAPLKVLVTAGLAHFALEPVK